MASSGKLEESRAWGMVLTVDPRSNQTYVAWPGANRGIYVRVVNGGPISKVAFDVGVSSGNISVAAYRNTGVGKAAVPTGAPLATSGAVACPASGLGEINLDATVHLNAGDWLFLSCDNTTATVARNAPISTVFNAGTAYRQDSAHPAPTVGTVAATSSIPVLIGYR